MEMNDKCKDATGFVSDDILRQVASQLAEIGEPIDTPAKEAEAFADIMRARAEYIKENLMEKEQNKQEDELHVGLVRVSIPLIWKVVKLPESYQMRGAYVNSNTNCIDIIVEHESLPVVDDATPIPEVVLTYTREYPLPHLNDVKLTDIKVSEHRYGTKHS